MSYDDEYNRDDCKEAIALSFSHPNDLIFDHWDFKLPMPKNLVVAGSPSITLVAHEEDNATVQLTFGKTTLIFFLDLANNKVDLFSFKTSK
jgi:hypothetical protein